MIDTGNVERVTDITMVPLEHQPAHVIGGKGDLRNFWTEIKDVSSLVSTVATGLTETAEIGYAHREEDGRSCYQDMPDGLTFEGTKDLTKITSELADFIPPKLLGLVAQLGLRRVHFNTLVRKGGGVPLGHKIHEGKPIIASYYRRIDYRGELGGDPAGSVAYETKVESANSLVFHALGGRTRLPICNFQLTSFNTPDGILSFPQAIEKGYFTPDAEPVLQLWGIRSPDRLRSFIRSLTGKIETEECPPPKVVSWKTKELTPQVNKQMVGYASRIVKVALADEDIRWRNLAERYRDSTFTKEDLSAFYLDYLEVFAATLGEQLGILYANQMIHYQMHAQNITLLGEIVDLDAILYPGYKSIYGEILDDEEMEKSTIVNSRGELFSEIELQVDTVKSRMLLVLDTYFNLVVNGVIQSDDKVALQRRVDRGLMNYGRGFAEKGIGTIFKPAIVLRNKRFIETHQTYLPFTHHGAWGDHFDPLSVAIKEHNPIYRLIKK